MTAVAAAPPSPRAFVAPQPTINPGATPNFLARPHALLSCVASASAQKKEDDEEERGLSPPPSPPLLPPTTPPASLTGSGGEGERRACERARTPCLCGWVARGGVCFSPGRTPADDRSINVIGLSGIELLRQAGREARSGRQWTPSAGEMSSGG